MKVHRMNSIIISNIVANFSFSYLFCYVFELWKSKKPGRLLISAISQYMNWYHRLIWCVFHFPKKMLPPNMFYVLPLNAELTENIHSTKIFKHDLFMQLINTTWCHYQLEVPLKAHLRCKIRIRFLRWTWIQFLYCSSLTSLQCSMENSTIRAFPYQSLGTKITSQSVQLIQW